MNQESELLWELEQKLIEPDIPEARHAKEDFAYFCEKIFGWTLKPFHRDVVASLQAPGRRMVFLLPRGFGKSSLCCCSWPLWLLAKNRDTRIVIATNTLRLGMEWLRQCETVMARNSRFRSWFGNMVPESRTLTWTDTEKIVLGRTPMATHTSLYAVGVGGSTLGKRADIICVDDILEPEEGVLSEAQANKVREWFWKILYPVLEPNGQICIIGTKFSAFDLYEELIADKHWPNYVISALDEKSESIWPERFSTEELMLRKEGMGSIIFNSQYMNDTRGSSGNLFRYEWLRFYQEKPDRKSLTVYQGIDPSLSAKESSDYFAIATIGYDRKESRVYLLDLIRTRTSPLHAIELIKQSASMWKPSLIGIETNAAQVLLKEYLQAGSMLRIKALPSRTDKRTRFISMSALFEAGKILIPGYRDSGLIQPTETFKPFVDEWCSFPRGRWDDTLDAVCMALELIPQASPPAASHNLEVKYSDYAPRARPFIMFR